MKTITKARERAEKHLEKQMWLAAWISFKTDLQNREPMVFSMGDTLVKFLMDATFAVPAGSDESQILKHYSTCQVRSMIEAVCITESVKR